MSDQPHDREETFDPVLTVDETGYTYLDPHGMNPTEIQELAGLGIRVINTRRLRAVAKAGQKIGYNRQLPDELLDKLHPNAKHILQPLVLHHFIDTKPAAEHLRVMVIAGTFETFLKKEWEPERAVMDMSLDVFRKLTPLRDPRHAKPDPKWEQVLELMSEFVTQLKTNPPMIGMRARDGSTESEKPYPLDWIEDLDPWFVAEDTELLLEKAADSMPSHILQPADLLSPTGFAVLERPLFMEHPDFGEIPIRVLCWKIDETGVWCSTLWDLDHEQAPAPDMDIRGYRSRLWPAIHFEFTWGTSADSVLQWRNVAEDERPVALELRKYLMALWLLSQQRVTVLSGARPARGLRRTAERLKLPSTVLVIRLRRPNPRHYDGEPNVVEWSHRWIVSGHWRRIWSEKENRMKLVWITPYVKGPEDKPLIVKDRFYRFER